MDHHMPVKHNEIHANVRWCILLSLKLAFSVNNFSAVCGHLLFFSLYLKIVPIWVYTFWMTRKVRNNVLSTMLSLQPKAWHSFMFSIMNVCIMHNIDITLRYPLSHKHISAFGGCLHWRGKKVMKLKPWRKSLMLKKHISAFLSEQVCFLFQLHSSSLSPIHSAICVWEVGKGDLLFVLLPQSKAVAETREL